MVLEPPPATVAASHVLMASFGNLWCVQCRKRRTRCWCSLGEAISEVFLSHTPCEPPSYVVVNLVPSLQGSRAGLRPPHGSEVPFYSPDEYCLPLYCTGSSYPPFGNLGPFGRRNGFVVTLWCPKRGRG